MRILPLALALSASAAFAQLGAPNGGGGGPQSIWTVGGQSFGPTLKGRFEGIQDGQPIQADLEADLGLGKDKTTPGFFLDYQGPRFVFQVSTGSAEYRGDRVIDRTVVVDGTPYPVGTRLQSRVKLASIEGVWTIKFLRQGDAWLGFDLGLQTWTLDLDAEGGAPGPQVPPLPTLQSSARVTAPIPQIGLSGGTMAYHGAVESKAFVRFLGYKGAKYTRYGVDVRIFPVRWFGLRAFYEDSRFDVPKGSVKDDLEMELDRKGTGFGVVIRF